MVVVSQRLLSLNPTTVLAILLLGLWLLLGCDNIITYGEQYYHTTQINNTIHLSSNLFKKLDVYFQKKLNEKSTLYS